MPSQSHEAQVARAAGRIAGRALRRNRYVNAGITAAQRTFTSVWRALRQLALEITGFLFLVFAAIGGMAAFREYQAYQAGRMGPGKSVVAVCFTMVFTYFGLSSFSRSRRK